MCRACRLAASLSEPGTWGRDRFLELLSAGGSDHPMTLLRNAGLDLSEPSTVRAVVDQLAGLVDRLEALV